MNHR
jgi:putative transposase